MYRMVVQDLDGPASLHVEAFDSLSVGRGEVGIDVKAAGCNFYDILITQGRYQVRPELPFAPGGEVAGLVTEVGEGVEEFAPGHRVTALLTHGGYASNVAAPIERVFAIPSEMSFEQAAAMGVVYQTSEVALVRRAAIQKGETLLVHAAAGGVGLAAVQIGAALGARVIGTAGSRDKLELVADNGADHVLNYREEDWVTRVMELTDGRGADVIYDPVGGDTFDASTKCIAFEGRILIVGFASGRIPNPAMNRVMVKNFSLVGIHWGLYFDRNPAVLQDSQRALSEMFAAGKINPIVSEVHPLKDAAIALEALGARKTTGKTVLVP